MDTLLMDAQLDQAVILNSHLRSLGAYATALLALEEENEEVTFLWDNEMIHEIMFPGSATSPYSGLLWLGLEGIREGSPLASGADWRVVIPEGARIELIQSLERVSQRYEALLRKLPQGDAIIPSSGLKDFSAKPEYQKVLSLTSQLQTLDHAVARLLVFLERYARPMGVAPTAIPAVHVAHFLERLQHERKYAADLQRNEADALNLASAEVVSRETNSSAVLVTATGAVLKYGTPWARDPMFFALAGYFKRKHPNRDSRRRVLTQMAAFIQDLTVRTETFTLGAKEFEKNPKIRRRDVSEFLHALENLSIDPMFIEITRLQAEAKQAVSSAFLQAKNMAAHLTALRIQHGGSPQALMGHLVAALDPDAAQPKDLSWGSNAALSSEPTPILSNNLGVIVDAALVDGGIAVSWESLDTLEEFLIGVAKFCSETHLVANQVFCRFPSRRGAATLPFEPQSLLTTRLKDVSNDEKMALLWVDAGTCKFWFDPGDLYFESVRVARKRTRLAVHIYSAELVRFAAMWICRTAVSFVPTAELSVRLAAAFSGEDNVSSN